MRWRITITNNATIPSDIWSVGKETLAMWHASFTDFFIKLWCYTDIGKQLFISNDKHRVRWEVLGLSQDGVRTDSLENFSVKGLKQDQSNDTKFNPPLFSLGNTFKLNIYVFIYLSELIEESMEEK